MYRKRHIQTPGFRMPRPHDPVTGKFDPLSPSRPYCRFVLTEALTTAMDRAAADITDQYGAGARHNQADTIHVFSYMTKEANEEADTDAVYRFAGAVGTAGIAVWHECQKWLIVELASSCGLIGACLDEDHPGRGEAFDIHLGAWDPTDDSGGKWVYDTAATAKAIDWRYGVPYPDAGSTGLFEPRESDEYGTIYECVALDCTSPGACGS